MIPLGGGASKSELAETSCNVLPRDLLLSFGGRGGRRRVELIDRVRIGSFSMGGGGAGELGESRVMPSGSRGSSGSTS